jgi:hypothetical protein
MPQSCPAGQALSAARQSSLVRPRQSAMTLPNGTQAFPSGHPCFLQSGTHDATPALSGCAQAKAGGHVFGPLGSQRRPQRALEQTRSSSQAASAPFGQMLQGSPSSRLPIMVHRLSGSRASAKLTTRQTFPGAQSESCEQSSGRQWFVLVRYSRRHACLAGQSRSELQNLVSGGGMAFVK